jgi:iron(III) transport system substrate-binding protein
LKEKIRFGKKREGELRVLLLFFQLLLFNAFAAAAWSSEPNWDKQWKETIAAANKEGRIVVMGSADPVVRRELPAAFKARFGITVEYIGGRGTDNSSRLRMERQAGLYSVDVIFAGVENMASVLHAEKMLDPLLPALLLPEVLDRSRWKKGKLWFVDPEEKYVLRLYNYVTSGGLYINTQHVKQGELKSVREIIDPKWKSKISLYDPTVPAGGDVGRFYMQFGEEFVRRLLVDQKPAISKDKRQIADWLARGSYPISLSAATELVLELKTQGLPVDVISLPDAPATLSAGNGVMALLNRAPHPNGARLFVNWMASKEGLEILARARHKPTTRNDIDESFVVPWEIPQPGINYFDTHDWEFIVTKRDKIMQRMKEILKSG